ncbi:GFA family protein [Rhizobium leguminosarum]
MNLIWRFVGTLSQRMSCLPCQMSAFMSFSSSNCLRADVAFRRKPPCEKDVPSATGVSPTRRTFREQKTSASISRGMSEKTTWIGGCLCGTCRYEFRGDRPHTGYCHCDMCKKATGGPFAVLVQASLEAFRWTKGRPRSYRSSPLRRAVFAICVGHLFTFSTTMTS